MGAGMEATHLQNTHLNMASIYHHNHPFGAIKDMASGLGLIQADSYKN